MLVRDVRSGRLVTVPDSRFFAQATAPLGYCGERGLSGVPFGNYAAGPQQPLYDGLGNPLGLPFLAALAPLASSLLPMIAKGASSLLRSLLPMLTGGGGAAPSPPALPMTPEPAPVPPPAPAMAPLPMEPAPPPMPMTPPSMPEPPDEIVAPMRMQRSDGQSVVVPVRLRRRRRSRRARTHGLHGWPGLSGWYGY